MAHTPHLYLPQPWSEKAVPLSKTAAHHLQKVLRQETGIVTYTDGAGQIGEGHLEGAYVVRGDEEFRRPPSPSITIAVAPPHERDRVRFMVEKLVELEIARIFFIRTRFGIGRLPDHSRANAWAIRALEQSQGAWLTEIAPVWIEIEKLEVAGLWFADRGTPLPREPLNGKLTIVIGPEGGWAKGEIPEGAGRFGLGRTILRVETAAIVAATLVRGPTV